MYLCSVSFPWELLEPPGQKHKDKVEIREAGIHLPIIYQGDDLSSEDSDGPQRLAGYDNTDC